MATVVLTQATNMSAAGLVTSLTNNYLNSNEFGGFGSDTGQFACVGDFSLPSPVVTRALIDTTDQGVLANIEITGLSYTVDSITAYMADFQPGNLQHILSLLLGGNDTIFGTAGIPDLIVGYAGNDTVSYAGASAGLFAGFEDGTNTGAATGDTYVQVENLIGSRFNDTLYGDGSVNRLSGGAGNDMLVGKDGGDVLDGGAGSDTAGYDTSLSPTLRADLLVRTTNTGAAAGDVYIGIENLAGSTFNDILLGNNLANILSGNVAPAFASGNDQLYGRGGNDALRGYDGTDRLYGGLGNDVLAGGTGADVFAFDTALNASVNRDTVTDFVHAQDKLWLENAIFTKLGAGVHALNPAFFRAGPAAADANDYVVYNRATGVLSYDANANAAGGAIAFAVLTNHPVLTATDFLVF